MKIKSTEEVINDLRVEITDLITTLFLDEAHANFDYKSGWLIFEAAAQEALINFFSTKFPEAVIQKAKGKNEYPDIYLITDDGKFAIDIKASASEKDPEFDIARIDTITKSRIDIYNEEWEIVIKYEKKSGKLVYVFFMMLREIVGVHKLSGGIKYRLYDGKVRPKSWKDFDNGVIYWNSKDDFKNGIKKSFDYRWTALISNHLVPNINEDEKKHYVSLFEKPIFLEEETDELNSDIEE